MGRKGDDNERYCVVMRDADGVIWWFCGYYKGHAKWMGSFMYAGGARQYKLMPSVEYNMRKIRERLQNNDVKNKSIGYAVLRRDSEIEYHFDVN